MKHLTKLILITIAAMTMTACNTIEGAGKDIKAGGKAIEETASDAKN